MVLKIGARSGSTLLVEHAFGYVPMPIENPDNVYRAFPYLVEDDMRTDRKAAQPLGNFIPLATGFRMFDKQLEDLVDPLEQALRGGYVVMGDVGPDLPEVRPGFRCEANPTRHACPSPREARS